MSKLKVLLLGLGVLLLSGCMLFGPGGPEILYEETFGNEADWYTGANENRDWWIEGGQYHVLLKTEDFTTGSWKSTLGPFSDFQLDVDTQQIAGPDDNGYGVQFRVQDGSNYYRFRISGDGWARFDKNIGGTITIIKPWERTDLIHQGNATNHIKVIANGSLFTFYINGDKLYEATDTSIAAGSIGFQAVMLTSPGQTHIAFDNLILTELE